MSKYVSWTTPIQTPDQTFVAAPGPILRRLRTPLVLEAEKDPLRPTVAGLCCFGRAGGGKHKRQERDIVEIGLVLGESGGFVGVL